MGGEGIQSAAVKEAHIEMFPYRNRPYTLIINVYSASSSYSLHLSLYFLILSVVTEKGGSVFYLLVYKCYMNFYDIIYFL